MTKILPDQNKVVLDNGREYTYRALVLANGLDHRSEFIEGLKELEFQDRSGVFVNKVDTKPRLDRNYYAGWQHFHGDLIVYQPAYPFRDEGLSFTTFYYDTLLKQERLQGRATQNATVQYWTPNKRIFNFDYANDVALEECRKRNIEVNFGWELKKVSKTSTGENWGVF